MHRRNGSEGRVPHREAPNIQPHHEGPCRQAEQVNCLRGRLCRGHTVPARSGYRDSDRVKRKLKEGGEPIRSDFRPAFRSHGQEAERSH